MACKIDHPKCYYISFLIDVTSLFPLYIDSGIFIQISNDSDMYSKIFIFPQHILFYVLYSFSFALNLIVPFINKQVHVTFLEPWSNFLNVLSVAILPKISWCFIKETKTKVAKIKITQRQRKNTMYKN